MSLIAVGGDLCYSISDEHHDKKPLDVIILMIVTDITDKCDNILLPWHKYKSCLYIYPLE